MIFVHIHNTNALTETQNLPGLEPIDHEIDRQHQTNVTVLQILVHCYV